ncbi:hypothetical protein [Sphingomonas hankookensis]|uniref:hypothetical protein n=1 Tax=Sphingomonas hankookensis TaxID=563996 RepID=UPI003D3019DF
MTGIATLASSAPGGTSAPLFADDRELAAGDVVSLTESGVARLIVAVRGPVTITAGDRLFALNASGGLWLPAGQGCRVLGRGRRAYAWSRSTGPSHRCRRWRRCSCCRRWSTR